MFFFLLTSIHDIFRLINVEEIKYISKQSIVRKTEVYFIQILIYVRSELCAMCILKIS